jgi:hypothetical protein
MGDNFEPVGPSVLSSILRDPKKYNSTTVELFYRDHRVVQNDNEHTYHIVYQGKRGTDLALCELSYSIITRDVEVKLVTKDWMQATRFAVESFVPLAEKNLTLLCTRAGKVFALHTPSLTLYNKTAKPQKRTYQRPQATLSEPAPPPILEISPLEASLPEELPEEQAPTQVTEAADFLPAPTIYKPEFVIPTHADVPKPRLVEALPTTEISLEDVLKEPLSKALGDGTHIRLKRLEAIRTASIVRALYAMTNDEEYVTAFVGRVQREFRSVSDVLGARLPTDALFNIIAKSELASEYKEKITLSPVLPSAVEAHIQNDWLPLQYALSAANAANVAQMQVRLWVDRELDDEHSKDVRKEGEILVRVPALVQRLTICATRAA